MSADPWRTSFQAEPPVLPGCHETDVITESYAMGSVCQLILYHRASADSDGTRADKSPCLPALTRPTVSLGLASAIAHGA
jgi:hypothetical protein